MMTGHTSFVTLRSRSYTIPHSLSLISKYAPSLNSLRQKLAKMPRQWSARLRLSQQIACFSETAGAEKSGCAQKISRKLASKYCIFFFAGDRLSINSFSQPRTYVQFWDSRRILGLLASGTFGFSHLAAENQHQICPLSEFAKAKTCKDTRQ